MKKRIPRTTSPRTFFSRLARLEATFSHAVARRQSRNFQIEQLESRHMMSAEPINFSTLETFGGVFITDMAGVHLPTASGFEVVPDETTTTPVDPIDVTQQLIEGLQWELDFLGIPATVGVGDINDFVFSEEQPVLVDGDRIHISTDTLAGSLLALFRELSWYEGNEVDPSQLELFSTPNDPLFPQQWHLQNTGQIVGAPHYQYIRGTPGEDINVVPAWALGYTGKGVVVAVVDDGVQAFHPDLQANILPGVGYDLASNDSNPNPAHDFHDAHGTAIAGIIAAVGNNGIGTTGIAYDAKIVPIRVFDPILPNPAGFLSAINYRNDLIDVYNHSYGLAGDGRFAALMTPEEVLAFRESVMFGRGGLGNIHVRASGNSGASTALTDEGILDYAAYSEEINSRYVISVTGFDHDGMYSNIDGTVTAYPEAGPSVLVAAPTGSVYLTVARETDTGSGIVTTDLIDSLTGAPVLPGTGYGYNWAPNAAGFEVDITHDFLPDGNYTSRFNGTSAAAPMVSGVVALMLEANPNLTWRDVQEILVRSARQVAQFEVPTQGDGTVGINTWIVNQDQFYRDPDPWDPTIDPMLQTLAPTMDAFNPATPEVWTNGAGYTVSQGRGANGEGIGYGHGAIDAELAVLLAEQWHAKGQNLAPERTFTTYTSTGFTAPARMISNQASGMQVIPGGLGGSAGFNAYWNEYFAMNPFSSTPPPRNTRGGGYIEFVVPASNAMSIETVELKLGNISGNADQLRITLISPNGIHSDFSLYYDTSPPNATNQTSEFIVKTDPPGDGWLGATDFVYSTNRNWGERSDAGLIIDPLTGEPYLDPLTGAPLTQNWRIHIENYGTSPISVGSVELAWHGTPINPNSQRIQGFVGIDQNQDTLFNFERYNQSLLDFDGDPSVLRLGELVRVADETQESFAANTTVSVRRQSDGFLVDQFVTGADGNFYFDLLPDFYVISVEGPEGYTAMDDPNVPNGYLAKYQQEWLITPDHFYAWDHDRPDVSVQSTYSPATDYDIPVDANGVPIPFLVGGFNPVPSNVTGVNFLLRSDVAPVNEVVFAGNVFNDLNANGTFDAGDTAASGARVFVDVNLNDAFDAADTWVVTDANGNYSLTVVATEGNLYQIGVVPKHQWQFSTPTGGFYTQFAQPGQTFDFDFGMYPPGVTPPGDGGGDGGGNDGGGNGGGNDGGGNGGGGSGTTTPGSIFGVVYFDNDSDGAFDANEIGASGFTVYIDSNSNGIYDAGDIAATTNASGGFSFADVPVGTHALRVHTVNGWAQTAPSNNAARVINLGSGQVFSNVQFGIKHAYPFDFGDLPDSYGTSLASNGARHGVFPGMSLGKLIDSEPNGIPSGDAQGDNMEGMQDEDGILNASSVLIQPGQPFILNIEVSPDSKGVLFLQGWIDYNNDGDFNDPGEHLQFRDPVTGAPLNTGTNYGNGRQIRIESDITSVMIVAPANIAGTELAARFRYGEATWKGVSQFNKPNGAAEVGEVEDYYLSAQANVATQIDPIAGDFDGSGTVDQGDYTLWKQSFGSTTDLRADANGDNIVDIADYTIWRNNLGASAPAALMAPVVWEDPIPDPHVGADDAPELVAYFESIGAVQQSAVINGEVVTYMAVPTATATSGAAGVLGDGGFFLVAEEQQGGNQDAPLLVEGAPAQVAAFDLAFDFIVDEREEDYEAIEIALTKEDTEEVAELALALALEEEYL